MALNKQELKSGIVSIVRDMQKRDADSVEEFAERLAGAIDTYVKGAKITYTSGLVAPNGAVTGTFNGKLE
ncbi:hypothetical protein [Sphingobacterium siyangense]|uniref:Uncharacterized protein n=1 Tax=Sphingobacterium siyangense TaxID=459529 RepID=A0A562MQK5_9SPHI|nr:hypothetical protein [Sphingobacterium siyangense]TWI22204.1 hypothetical protein IQ31_01609 [Sphingobacterium siyangense]